MLRCSAKKIAKSAHGMWPDRVAFVIGDKDMVKSLASNDIEVIEPEVDHHLFELPRAFNCRHQPKLTEMDSHLLVESIANREPAAGRATGPVLHRRLYDFAIDRDEVGLRHFSF